MKVNKQKNSKQGFTLLELLVVILIIGILAGIALPQYNKAVWKSRFIQAKTLARNIADSEEMYYTVHSQYTNNFENLDIDLNPDSYSDTKDKINFKWGNCYIYSQENFGERQEVHCTIYKNGKGFLHYLLEFANGRYFSGSIHGKNRARCIADGVTDKPTSNDINYKICSEETNYKNPVSFGMTTLSWEYN